MESILLNDLLVYGKIHYLIKILVPEGIPIGLFTIPFPFIE